MGWIPWRGGPENGDAHERPEPEESLHPPEEPCNEPGKSDRIHT